MSAGARNECTALVEELTAREMARLERCVSQLAGYVHDLGSPILSLSAALETTDDSSPVFTQLRAHMGELRALVNQAHQEIRTLTMPSTEFACVRAVAGAVIERVGVRFPTVTITAGSSDLLGVSMRGGAPSLGRVIENLVTNACLARGVSRVEIRWSRDDAHARIAVDDDGPGFEDAAPRPKTQGLGLGLFSARRLVEASLGTMTLGVSNSLGGARVTVELPTELVGVTP